MFHQQITLVFPKKKNNKTENCLNITKLYNVFKLFIKIFTHRVKFSIFFFSTQYELLIFELCRECTYESPKRLLPFENQKNTVFFFFSDIDSRTFNITKKMLTIHGKVNFEKNQNEFRN